MIVYGKKVLTLIIKYHNDKISKEEKSYNKKILGKTITNWTKEALAKLKPKTVLLNEQNTLNSALQKYVNDFDYVAVFYYDTPLITEKNATDSIDYAVLKELDVCNLPKGFVFKTEFIISQLKQAEDEKQGNNSNKRDNLNLASTTTTISLDNSNSTVDKNKNINPTQQKLVSSNNNTPNQNVSPPNTQSFMHYEAEFLQAYDLNNLSKIENVILKKIINKHKQNGVVFVGEQNVIIDYNCKIGGGTVVYPNNYILNGSVVGKNSTLMPGNIINNSSIIKALTLIYCVVTNSSIKKSTLPFSVIENNVLVK